MPAEAGDHRSVILSCLSCAGRLQSFIGRRQLERPRNHHLEVFLRPWHQHLLPKTTVPSSASISTVSQTSSTQTPATPKNTKILNANSTPSSTIIAPITLGHFMSPSTPFALGRGPIQRTIQDPSRAQRHTSQLQDSRHRWRQSEDRPCRQTRYCACRTSF